MYRNAFLATAMAVGTAAALAGPPLAAAGPESSMTQYSSEADCVTGLICEDFEAQPGPAPGGRWSVTYPDCQGDGTAIIDTTVAHGGNKSLRVDGGAGYCNHVFVGTSLADVTGTELYGRYYVRHEVALPPAHVTFMAMTDRGDGGKDLRMGGQNGALQWNRESDDATLPEQSPNGVAASMPLPTDRWTCVEFAVDGGEGTLRTWVDGNLVPGLVVDGTATHDIDGQWLRGKPDWRPALTDFRLGWESYGGGEDTLWYDDIVLGSTRIGC